MKSFSKFIFVFSFLFLFFISEAKADVILPSYPQDFDSSWPHVIVYDPGWDRGYLFMSYCKNSSYNLSANSLYQVPSDVAFFGTCYDSNGNNMGSAYRRTVSLGFQLSQQDIKSNSYDFSSFSWGNESTSQMGISVDESTGIIVDYSNYLDQSNWVSPLLFTNVSLYNSNSTDILYSISSSNFRDLGSYEDVSILTYKILDSDPGIDKEVNLTLSIDNPNNDSLTFDIYKYGSSIFTQYSKIL